MTREEQKAARFEKEFENVLEELRRQDADIAALEDSVGASEAEVANAIEVVREHSDELAAVVPALVGETPSEAREEREGHVRISHRFVLRA